MTFPNPKIKTALFLSGILLTAFLVRFYNLGDKGLWVDEAYSVHLAGLPLRELLRKLTAESTPPLYYLLLNGWIRVAGISEMSVRFPSLIFSMLQPLIMFVLIKKRLSQDAAYFVALLIAFSPLHVYYAQEARMYSLLALLGILLFYYSLSFIEEGNKSSLIGVSISSIAMLLIHNVGAWFVAGVMLAFFMIVPDIRRRIAWLLTFFLTGLLYIPWFLNVLKQIASQKTILDWFTYFWNQKSPLGHLYTMCAGFTFGPYPPYLAIDSVLVGNAGLVIFAFIFCCYGIISNQSKLAIRYTCLFLMVAIILAIAYSIFIQPVLIPGRTDHYFLPFFLFFLGTALTCISSKWARYTILIVWCILSGITLSHYYKNPRKNTSRDFYQGLKNEIKAQDTIISTGLTYAVCDYYVKRYSMPVSVHTYPMSLKDHPGYFNEQAFSENLVLEWEKIVPILQEARKTGIPKKNIYLLLTPHTINQAFFRQLESYFGYHPQFVTRFHQSLIHILVTVYKF